MKKLKQVLSVLLAVVMVVCTVPVMEAGAASFTPRLSAPERTGYYGTQNSYNPFRTNSSAGNGNCTWYAWGRAYELLGSRPQLSTGNANTWYPRNQSNGAYPYGSTPKLGAIACWATGDAGHVAVVEAINDDGTITISESSWGATSWWFRTNTIRTSYYSSFQGFIYIGDFSNAPVYDVLPQGAWIWSDKTTVPVNGEVRFNYNATYATSFVIGVESAQGLTTIDVGSNDWHTIKFDKAGTYAVHVAAYNNLGHADTDYITINVYDTVPQGAWIWSDKTSIPINGEVRLNYNATYATHFVLGVWDGQELSTIDVGTNDWHTLKFEKAGSYSIHAAIYNEFGHADTEEILITVYDPNHTHAYTSTVTTPATCSATGVRTYTCSCGASYTETIPVNSSNHVNTKNVAATASTCTVKGYTAGVYCNDCKKYISGHAEQSLAPHQTTIINAKEATYEADGYTGDTYCTVCKQTISYGTVIPMLVKPDDPTDPSNPSEPTNPENPTNPTQPENPTQPATQPQQQSGACRYCGGTHTGFPGILIGFIHSILALFGLKK